MCWLHMCPFQWYLKTNWQYPQLLDLKIPVSNRSRKNITYQCPRTKSSVSSPKRLSKQNSKQKHFDSNIQCHCGQLSEQTGDICLLVWCILAYCNPPNNLIRARQPLQKGQCDPDRVVPSSSIVRSDLQSLVQTKW